jgi:hypothetical protein
MPTTATPTTPISRRLRELLQPLTAADGHDARQSAEDDVDAQLDGAHDDGGEHADDRGQDDRRPGVEEDRGEQPRRGQGNEEGHDRAVRGELQAERRRDQKEPDQQQRVVAVPEDRPEAPHPAEEEDVSTESRNQLPMWIRSGSASSTPRA